MKQRKITVTKAAELLGVSKQAVSKSPRVARKKDGSVDAEKTVANLGSLESANLRKQKALASRYELELDEKRGRVVRVEKVEDAWVTITRRIREGVLRLPAKLAPQLVGVADEARVRGILEAECHLILRNLADEIRSEAAA